MKVFDLTDGMETLTDLFRRATDSYVMEDLTDAEVLLLTRAYASLTWAMLRAFENSSVKRVESYGEVRLRSPFKDFTKSLWMTREDASRARERIAERRRKAS